MDQGELKQAVRERYGAIANSGGSCCGPAADSIVSWRRALPLADGSVDAIIYPLNTESAQIEQGLANLTDREPADPEVQELIRRHYQQINDRFYTCPLEMYRGLGGMRGGGLGPASPVAS
ncbi:MAG TPA: hypothetical protein GXX28_05735 [Firmicutes bacterium]|nr:hypothetical protein [Bacillota bacterium]